MLWRAYQILLLRTLFHLNPLQQWRQYDLRRLEKTSILFQVRYSILRAHRLVVSDLGLETKGSHPAKVFVRRLEVAVRR